VGAKVTKGDKLLTLEAMKMQTTIYAPCDGVVEQIFVQVGETVESKDLLMRCGRGCLFGQWAELRLERNSPPGVRRRPGK
jgi:hypothetical protein